MTVFLAGTSRSHHVTPRHSKAGTSRYGSALRCFFFPFESPRRVALKSRAAFVTTWPEAFARSRTVPHLRSTFVAVAGVSGFSTWRKVSTLTAATGSPKIVVEKPALPGS